MRMTARLLALVGSAVVLMAGLGHDFAMGEARLGAAASLRDRLNALPVSPDLGGATTKAIVSEKAFSLIAGNAAEDHVRPFFFGNRLFNTNWTIAPGSVKSFDGLGPTFNRVSCSGCHTRDGRGAPPTNHGDTLDSMLIRLSVPGATPEGGPREHPLYGGQLNELAIPDVPAEGRTLIAYNEMPGQFADGIKFSLRKPSYTFTQLSFGPLGPDTMISPRVAPQMIGLGLLEAVPDETLLALADPNDADGDGISGRVNRVWDTQAKRKAVGRFGWKANVPNLLQQDASAARGDIGLTTSMFPAQNCPPGQTACAAQTTGGEPEISDEFMEKLILYSRLLAVPAQRNPNDPQVRRGAELFAAANCNACHVTTLKTRADAALPELANQTFHPFTDLLLHDMGEGLADNRPDFEASGREWRTPPLWGIGLFHTVNRHTNFLHDGRARNLDEAILWHGGEGEASKEAYRAMSKDERDALLAYLGSL